MTTATLHRQGDEVKRAQLVERDIPNTTSNLFPNQTCSLLMSASADLIERHINNPTFRPSDECTYETTQFQQITRIIDNIKTPQTQARACSTNLPFPSPFPSKTHITTTTYYHPPHLLRNISQQPARHYKASHLRSNPPPPHARLRGICTLLHGIPSFVPRACLSILCAFPVRNLALCS